MMPHIVAYVGSRNPESRTCQAITMVKGTLDEHQAKLLADDIATTLKNLPKHPAFNPSSGQEMMFNAYRQQFVRRGKTDYEYRYWKEHGLFTCDTLHDYFVRISRDPRLNAMTAPLMGRRQSNEEGTGK